MQKRLLFFSLALASGMAVAQTSGRPDPTDPKARAPARPYESAFKDYRSYADQEAARWRESNDEMGKLGGHAGHSQQRSPAKPASKAPAHGGHGDHK